jgi:hypothetical protein
VRKFNRPEEIEMFTNRLFNLFVALALVTLAAFTGWQTIATAKAVADRSYDQVEQAQPEIYWSPDYSVGKHEERYDRMNGFEGTDHLYKYEDRYDVMNDGLLSNDRSYNLSKYEDRYDRMNDFSGTDR